MHSLYYVEVQSCLSFAVNPARLDKNKSIKKVKIVTFQIGKVNKPTKEVCLFIFLNVMMVKGKRKFSKISLRTENYTKYFILKNQSPQF